MNQYIITENLLDRLYDAGYSRGCMERDEEHNKKLGVLYKEAESHPYNPQAEREKVLDEFYNKLKPEYVEIFEGVSWDDVERVYAELRQEGKQEQP